MSSLIRTMLPAFALAAMMSAAQAQTATGQDHDAHHPADQGAAQTQAAPPAAPGSMGSGGMPGMMMGMDRMRSMMGQPGGPAGSGPAMSCSMMGQHAAMGSAGGMGMPFEHVEGRIAFLKAELGITDAQAKAWNAFADALRANAKAMRGMHDQMTKAGMPAAWTERLDLQEKMLATRADAVRALKAAASPLFASFSAEQRALADKLLTGPMGMM